MQLIGHIPVSSPTLALSLCIPALRQPCSEVTEKMVWRRRRRGEERREMGGTMRRSRDSPIAVLWRDGQNKRRRRGDHARITSASAEKILKHGRLQRWSEAVENTCLLPKDDIFLAFSWVAMHSVREAWGKHPSSSAFHRRPVTHLDRLPRISVVTTYVCEPFQSFACV